jgi:hypothetical protein
MKPGVDRALYGGGQPDANSRSSIYPAARGMLLAARALGLGATLTSLYLKFEKEVEAALGSAAGRALVCAIAERLSDGSFRAGAPGTDRRCRL